MTIGKTLRRAVQRNRHLPGVGLSACANLPDPGACAIAVGGLRHQALRFAFVPLRADLAD